MSQKCQQQTSGAKWSIGQVRFGPWSTAGRAQHARGPL